MERQGPLPSTSASVAESSGNGGSSDARRVTSNQASGIQQLPDKVLEYIFSFLNLRALRQASDTCRGWRQIVGTYVDDNAERILRRQRERQPNSNQMSTCPELPSEVLNQIFSSLDFRALRQASNTCRLWRGIVAAYMGNAQLTLKAKRKQQPEKGRNVPIDLNIYRTLLDNPDVLALARAEPEVGNMLKAIQENISTFTEEETAASSSDQASKPERTQEQTGLWARATQAIWGDSSPVEKKWSVPPETPLWSALYMTVARCIRKQNPLILHKAFQMKHWRAMRAFALWGADIDLKDKGGMTILGLACSSNRPQSVMEIISWGANPNTRNGKDGWTPLHLVVVKGLPRRGELVLELLRTGANPNMCNKDPARPHSPYEIELIRVLANRKVRGKYKLSMLDALEVLNALRNANLPFRKRLCLNEISTPTFQRPVQQPVALQNVDQLLEEADRIRVSKYRYLILCEPPDYRIGWRPIHRAVSNIKVARLGCLLEDKRVEARLPTLSGWTPLQLAVWVAGDDGLTEEAYDACVKMVRLLAERARPNIDRPYKFSSESKYRTLFWRGCRYEYNCGVGDIPPIPGPLQLAVISQLPDLVKTLCQYGANPHYDDGTLWGYTPFQFMRHTWPREVLFSLVTQALGIHPEEQADQSSEDGEADHLSPAARNADPCEGRESSEACAEDEKGKERD